MILPFHRILCCLFFTLVALSGCQPERWPSPVSVNYTLSSKKDISADQDTIRIRLIMLSGSQVLLDSALYPMALSQFPVYPRLYNWLKLVPAAHVNDTLVVGFEYSIDNVGQFRYADTGRVVGQKTVTLSF